MGDLNKNLIALQNELNAPKNLYNKFGNYYYRNAESILEAVKPLLKKYKLLLNVCDEIIQIGERYYVAATATIISEDGESIYSKAYAREPLDKKGMDDSQITGTSSSYARKYALNGLFLIDDTKDADTNEYHEQNNKPVKDSKADVIDKVKIETIKKKIADKNVQEQSVLKSYQLTKFEDMTLAQWENAMKRLDL